MSRVHCLTCGTAVVVDPAGRCPDGHQVGAAGARIDTALASDVVHPDEPEPWVARVELDDLDEDPAAEAAPEPIRPAPLRLPADDRVATGDGHAPSAAPVDSDELLRELHSLSDLGGLDAAVDATAPARQVPPASRPDTPTPPPATPQVATPPVATDAEGAMVALAELSALEAVVHSIEERQVAAPAGTTEEPAAPPARTDGPAPVADDDPAGHLAEVTELFAPATPPGPPSAPTPAPPPPPATGDHRPRVAPAVPLDLASFTARGGDRGRRRERGR